MHHSANATRLRHRCTVLLLTASLGLGGLASTGCQTLSTAQSGMQTGVSTAQTTKSTADQTKQLGTDLKGEVDKVTGKKTDGAGGAAGDKPEDEDGKRLQAKSSKLNQPVNDELNQTKNDLTD